MGGAVSALPLSGGGTHGLFPEGWRRRANFAGAQTDANDFPGGAGYLWPQLATAA